MIAQGSVLVQLVRLLDCAPATTSTRHPRRGRPTTYPDGLFLKALVVMALKRLHRVGELLAVLREPTPEMIALRELLSERGRFPSRRTFERRLRALTETLPERIGCLRRHLVRLLAPWARSGRAVAIDSTVLRAKGGVWHKKDREAAVVPHSSIDTEAGWTKSGWHGWVYGWKLHLSCTMAGVWIPLAARLTPANAADNRGAPLLIEELPEEARFVLGDSHYNAPTCARLAWRKGASWWPAGGGPTRTSTGRGGAARVSQVAPRLDRELQRALQGRLRCLRSGAHQGATRHRALRPGGGLRLPTRVALPPRARAGYQPRARGLLPSRLKSYDQPSVS